MAEKGVYRTKGQSAIIAGSGLAISLIGITSIIVDYPEASWAARVGAILPPAIVGWFMVFRVARARVCVQADGIRIVNALRSVFLPWDRISRFTLHPWRWVWTPIGHAELKEGPPVHILGIAARNPRHWPKDRSADEMIERLNHILRWAQSGHPPV